jgi:hypothetical protein
VHVIIDQTEMNIDRQNRFENVSPVRFRVGDIVEVQMTVIAVPVKQEHFKMIIQLRSIALMMGVFTEVSL